MENKNMKTNSLLRGLEIEDNFKYTENGALANTSTLNPILDAFGEIGALRTRSTQSIINLFMKAYNTDRLLAMKMLFYTRDIREGLGERRTFRIILQHLAKEYPEDVIVNLSLIAEYGRWDDFYILVDTPVESAAFAFIAKQFDRDIVALQEAKGSNKPARVSLLGKWLKSENTSSRASRLLAEKTRKYLHLNAAQYRKALSALRKAIKVVEVDMSNNEWGAINYEAVPSLAAKLYREAFKRHDGARYNEFLQKVNTGEAKINASTLYPYDIVRHYLGEGYSYDNTADNYDATLEAQWKALPNYLAPGDKFLVMADVSGSMFSNNNTPISTSVGLALYFAQHSTGAFAGNFMTFTDRPHLCKIPQNLTLHDQIEYVLSKGVGYDTNLEAAFNMVLKTAVDHHVPAEDMPKAFVIISDMEINEFGHGDSNLNFTATMERKFEAAGYKMPVLVYWNVDARQDTFHATSDQNVRFISGSSANIFKGLCEHLGYTAIELMLATLNSERYAAVQITK